MIQALFAGGFRRISLLESKGTLRAVSDTEVDFSPSGRSADRRPRFELVCEDHEVEAATAIVRTNAQLARRSPGGFTSARWKRRYPS